MNDLGVVFDVALLASTVRLVSPILLAALGGMITERAGIFNVSLEGLMLVGAFAAVVGTAWTDQPTIGVVAAAGAAIVVSLVFAFVVVDLRGDAIVAGLAINLFALGATTFLMRAIFGVQGGYYDPTMPGLPEITIPVVADIPILGPLLSGHTILVYVGIAAVVVLQVLLFHHKVGLRTRAVGEDPVAAGSVGIRVRRVSYGAVLGCGLLCGLAGAQHHRHAWPRRLHGRGRAVAACARRRGSRVRRGRRRRAAERDGVAPGRPLQRAAHRVRQQDGPRRR
jgi:simple sugar transport system permease protein